MNALRVATLAIKPVPILLAAIGVAASKDTFWQQIIKIARVSDVTSIYYYGFLNTVWPEILAGNLFWRIGQYFIRQKLQCDVIIIAES